MSEPKETVLEGGFYVGNTKQDETLQSISDQLEVAKKRKIGEVDSP